MSHTPFRIAATALLICALCAPTSAQVRTIEPYLQSATPNDIWIMWETSSGDGVVEWGASDSLGEAASAETASLFGGSRLHTAHLTGLAPATRYFYRTVTGDDVSEIFDFITPPTNDSEAPTRLVAISDMQRDGGNPDVFRALVNDGVIEHLADTVSEDLAAALSLVLVPGDLVDNGLAFDEWANEFFGPAANLFSSVPLYPVLGNHEANSFYYFDYFHLPENGDALYDEHWWASRYSNIVLLGLDSNGIFRLPAQLEWLDDRLAEACSDDTVDFVFAELHHPYRSELWLAGETDFTGDVISRLEGFTRDCGKPSIHFYGHTHGYSRGQTRDHAHLMVNVASAGGNIDYWGEYAQRDYVEYVTSQPEYGFVVVEVEAGDDPSFLLQRVTRGDETTARDNEISDEIEVRRYNRAPRTPAARSASPASYPANCVYLGANPFRDRDGDSQSAAHWQVSTSCEDFSSPTYERWLQHRNEYFGVDTQADDDLTDELVIGLEADRDYCWRVRFRDSSLGWSEWSAPQPFSVTEGVSAEGNLVDNPGAEEGTTGWTVIEDHLESLTADECQGISPHSGERYFAVGGLCDHSAFGQANQRVDVGDESDAIDADELLVQFGGYLSDFNGSDRPALLVAFINASGDELSRSAPLSTTADSWTLMEATVPVPRETRAIDLIMTGTRNAGTDNDSYLDDLFLRLVDAGEACLPAPIDEPSGDAEPIAEPVEDAGRDPRVDAPDEDSADGAVEDLEGDADADADADARIEDADSPPDSEADEADSNAPELGLGDADVDGDVSVDSPPGGSSAEDGCGCAATEPTGAGLWVLLGAVVVLARRRRR